MTMRVSGRTANLANREFVETPNIDRHALAVSDIVEGPAVEGPTTLKESSCTSFIPPERTVEVSEDETLRVDR